MRTLVTLLASLNPTRGQALKGGMPEYYRADGVRITHDPYAAGMAEKYGTPGKTDNEGFDPYADTVGPGIYGGIVKRGPDGAVLIGKQYQNHNRKPGPIYAGGGYTPVNSALNDVKVLKSLLNKYPDLVNDISTGGATPLHMCGMGGAKQGAVRTLVEAGGDIEAVETYGFTPLQRMASNNLAVGARMLLEAGADPNFTGQAGESPLGIARGSRANDVIAVLKEFSGMAGNISTIAKINIMGSGFAAVEGDYLPKDASMHIPEGFARVCNEQGWEVQSTWQRLSGSEKWFAHADDSNDSYIYWNRSDGKWWIDGPDGMGVYICSGPKHAPPAHGWQLISNQVKNKALPMVRAFRKYQDSCSNP